MTVRDLYLHRMCSMPLADERRLGEKAVWAWCSPRRISYVGCVEWSLSLHLSGTPNRYCVLRREACLFDTTILWQQAGMPNEVLPQRKTERALLTMCTKQRGAIQESITTTVDVRPILYIVTRC